MSTQKIIQRIQHDTKREIQKITKENENQVKSILAQAKQEAQQKAKQVLLQGQIQADTQKKILLSQASQEMKRELMNAKEEIIERCFTQTLEKLKELREDRYQTILTALLEDGRKKIKGEYTVSICRATDRAFIEKHGGIVDGQIPGSGGLRLHSQDGRITVDNTFEGILKRKKHDIRIQVGKLLFSSKG